MKILLLNSSLVAKKKWTSFFAGAHAKIGNGKMRNALVGAVVIGLVGYGLVLATKAMAPSNTSHFEANNNTIINIGAGEANISPDRLQAIIESTVTNKKTLAKSSIKTLAPARADEGSTMVIGTGGGTVTIPAETIKKPQLKLSSHQSHILRIILMLMLKSVH